ncbi:hypothetical protein BKA00_001074 [Actinomadura coerulea]|uniref:Uncharacterized protein n=1 Tax=Actinomadura coerulea TaxID=46159 RepID=A0A7X0FUW5_9ACTN|nr:hypothetical protein [Actinomadura coerulea]MBB6394160.1 hypothetical protein [Actinomadura coerulea]GGQ20579.1 hypothetical protein GCM10010187_41280 [Actinomadura coerulea]
MAQSVAPESRIVYEGRTTYLDAALLDPDRAASEVPDAHVHVYGGIGPKR